MTPLFAAIWLVSRREYFAKTSCRYAISHQKNEKLYKVNKAKKSSLNGKQFVFDFAKPVATKNALLQSCFIVSVHYNTCYVIILNIYKDSEEFLNKLRELNTIKPF